MRVDSWQLDSLRTYFEGIWEDNCDKDASSEVIELFKTNCFMAEEMIVQVQLVMRERHRKCRGMFSPSQVVMNGEDYNTVMWLGMHIGRMTVRVKLLQDAMSKGGHHHLVYRGASA
mgnify:CR=1 FL=1